MGSTAILTMGFVARAAFGLALVLGGLALPFAMIGFVG